MSQSSSLIAGLIDIYVEPKKALNALKSERGWTAVPLVLVLLVPVVLISYYFLTVDFEWMVDAMFASASPEEMPPEAREFLTADRMLIFGVVGAIFASMAMLALSALYLNFLAKMTDTAGDFTYSNWFSLSVWANMPAAILASLASLAYYMLSGTNQVGLDELAFFSLNSLVTQIPLGQPGASIMGAITPFSLWSVVLVALGLETWTGRTFGKALLLAAIPTVIIYSVWAVVSFG